MEPLNMRDRVALAKRSPRRISVTVSHALAAHLEQSAYEQGRSISNLCAHLLENAVPPGN